MADEKNLNEELEAQNENDVIDEEGPSHNKVFTVVVKIDGIVYGKGVAHSKKEAEQEAAHDALKKAQNVK